MSNVKQLHISQSAYLPDRRQILWHNPGTYNNDRPFIDEVHLDSRELVGKEDSEWWRPYEDISRLEIIGDIPGGFEFIRNLKNLRSLGIFQSDMLDNLRLIEGLYKLEFLQIVNCPLVSDITPVVNLRNKQYFKRHENEYKSLQNIILRRCTISSLDAFRKDKTQTIGELHLRRNSIEDVEPLAGKWIDYLSLSHNKVKDIGPLYSKGRSVARLNVRHNKITRVSEALNRFAKSNWVTELWIADNPLEAEEYFKINNFNQNIRVMDIG